MWIRCVDIQDKEVMINLDKIESIQYEDQNNATVLYVAADPNETGYKIKGTPDRIFNALRRKDEVSIVYKPT